MMVMMVVVVMVVVIEGSSISKGIPFHSLLSRIDRTT